MGFFRPGKKITENDGPSVLYPPNEIIRLKTADDREEPEPAIPAGCTYESDLSELKECESLSMERSLETALRPELKLRAFNRAG
jgi:hypothetical protein